eukprot:CAMPEP_0117764010 /NCGR_PEP_ID=MMETSP0947-20121206/19089_1 /TAXON_ID=44440 /ORGANISM="Chattonella subsalsa, Strain CCMP2191" /LENGTH=158 /DNA_ID=CAMNT_0005586047 /DNA_START=309 /DNA_END=785 /DNA_ORIENTATION=-
MMQKEHKSPEFLKVNPFGKLPVISQGDLNIFESGAILLYIADKYGDLKTPEERALAAQWAMFANASLGPALFITETREKTFQGTMDVLNEILSKEDYLVSNTFSVSDIAVGAYLCYLPLFFPDMDLSPWPAVQDYMARLSDREAFKNTVGARVTSPES